MKKLLTLLTLVTVVLVLGTPAVAGDTTPGPVLKINRDKGDQCVEPTDVMRKNHMKFLLHQRDETMHRGIRTKQHSLKECIECHANKDEAGNHIAVTAPGEFCQACHAYASVKMDCFECHAAKPRDTAFRSLATGKRVARDADHDKQAAGQLLNRLLAR